MFVDQTPMALPLSGVTTLLIVVENIEKTKVFYGLEMFIFKNGGFTVVLESHVIADDGG